VLPLSVAQPSTSGGNAEDSAGPSGGSDASRGGGAGPSESSTSPLPSPHPRGAGCR
jgi:hypothetical protein